MSTIMTAARQISISNRADGVACAVWYCVALLDIAFICAMNGRILRSTKNIFAIAPFFGWTIPAGKSTRNPSISAVWANTFFFTDRPSNPKVPLIAACTCSCASVAYYRLPSPKKSSTKVNTTHMQSA